MTLTPNRPPGRPNRKALAFAPEIGRLHRLGYSAEAIRQTLADAGLIVSRRTVTREVARHPKHPRVTAMTREALGAVVTSSPLPTLSAGTAMSSLPADRRTGREIAADFFSNRITNSLLRNRSTPP